MTDRVVKLFVDDVWVCCGGSCSCVFLQSWVSTGLQTCLLRVIGVRYPSMGVFLNSCVKDYIWFNCGFIIERSINFLGVIIHREITNFSIEIYRIPTCQVSITPSDSCHPTEHKLAAIQYLHSSMNNYQLPPDRKQEEENIIQQILHNIEHDNSISKSLLGKQIN